MTHAEEVSLLAKAAEEHVRRNGEGIVSSIESTSATLRAWIGYLDANVDTGVATALLTGTRAALVETTACLCLGLIRPALFSMRATIDMGLAWLFFNEHPAEWRLVVDRAEGYKLPGEILAYLKRHIAGFGDRLETLSKKSGRRLSDPYGTLSAYVHGQAPRTMPEHGSLATVVRSDEESRSALELHQEICGYLSDVYFAVYASRWHDLQATVQHDIAKRLTPAELKRLLT